MDSQWTKVCDLKVGEEIAVAGNLNALAPGVRKTNAYGQSVSSDIVQFHREPTEQLLQPEETKQLLQSFFPSFSLSGQNKNPKIRHSNATANTPIFTFAFRSLKNPLKQLPMITYLKISKNAVETNLFLSRWNNAIKELYHGLKVLSTHGNLSFSTPAYAQVAEPQNGFTDILWDRIISIEVLGREQVYDIEVEGTHNFVAGHFVKKQDVAGKLESWDKAGELGSWEAE